MKNGHVVGLERPHFGQLARRVAKISSREMEACLRQQKESGGRLGEILRSKGLLERDQIREVLKLQAASVAEMMSADFPEGMLPYPSFLSFCMPAYNEKENIEDTLDTACSILPELVERFEVVVVDDGSKDGTGDIVEAYSRRDSRVRLVRHEQNQGYGGAVTSGLRSARGDLVAFTDSDGQFSFLDLPQLLTHLDGHDVVVGYRYRRADSRIRLLNAWGWNCLVRLALGVRIQDLDCAFKLFRREVVDRLRLTAKGAAINAEIMAQCVRGGLRICETPVSHYPRYAGAPTGAAFKVILRAFKELPRMMKYRFEPVSIMTGGAEPASESLVSQEASQEASVLS